MALGVWGGGVLALGLCVCVVVVVGCYHADEDGYATLELGRVVDCPCPSLYPLEAGENHLPLACSLRAVQQIGYDLIAEILVIVCDSEVIYPSGIVAICKSFDLQNSIMNVFFIFLF